MIEQMIFGLAVHLATDATALGPGRHARVLSYQKRVCAVARQEGITMEQAIGRTVDLPAAAAAWSTADPDKAVALLLGD